MGGSEGVIKEKRKKRRYTCGREVGLEYAQ